MDAVDKVGEFQEILEKLEHPEFDPALMQVSRGVLARTAKALREAVIRVPQVLAAVDERLEEAQRHVADLQLARDCSDTALEVRNSVVFKNYMYSIIWGISSISNFKKVCI